MSFGNEREFIDFLQAKEKGGRAKMFCPLLWIAKPEVDIGLSSEHDCLKEECAWWDEVKNCCCIKVIGKESTLIQLKLSDMIDKMPHERSYVK